MKRCELCGRPLVDNKNCYGLACLRKMCLLVGIDDVKNLKRENDLNTKIQKITSKGNLNKIQKQLLTERYLTFKLLSEVDIEYYKVLSNKVEQDINKIDNVTKETDLPTNSLITLKEAFEIYRLYRRYTAFKKELDYVLESGKLGELQNLVWDTILFAYSSYYNKKPYLSHLTQVIQFVLWEIAIVLAKSIGLVGGAEFLQHSLKENPKDKFITKGLIIDKIEGDERFKKKIKDIIAIYGNNKTFDTLDKETLNYEKKDLFLALNNTDINVKGKKQKDKWILDITITDKYDFTDFREISEYYEGDFVTAFLGSLFNNAAMLSYSFNVINEYNITINFKMESDSVE